MNKNEVLSVGIKPIQTPIRLDVSTENASFAVFLANLLNKNEILVLAIIDANFEQNHTIFCQNCSFLQQYFYQVSERPILAVQIPSKFVIAETAKMVLFGG